MKTHSLTIPERRSHNRALSFVRRTALLLAMSVLVPWNTYAANCEEMNRLDKEFSEAFQDMKSAWTAKGAREEVEKMRMIWSEKMHHLTYCLLCRADMGGDVESKIGELDKQMQRMFENLEKSSDPKQTEETIDIITKIAEGALILIPIIINWFSDSDS